MANSRGEYPDAIGHLEKALAFYRKDDDRDGEDRALGTLGTVLYKLGRYEESRSHHERALAFFTESGHRLNQAVTMGNIAEIDLIQGDLGAARRLAGEGLSLCEQLGDREGMGLFRSTRGSVYRRVGKVAEAAEDLSAALAIADEVGLDWLASSTQLELALACLTSGDIDEGARHAAESVRRAGEADSPLHSAVARLGRARVLVALGELETADRDLGAAASMGAQLELGHLVAEATAGSAAVALARGDADVAARLVTRVLPRLEQPGLEGCLDPTEVYMVCLRSLAEHDDTRVGTVLTAAARHLESITSRMGDEDSDLRAAFLASPATARLLRAIEAAG